MLKIVILFFNKYERTNLLTEWARITNQEDEEEEEIKKYEYSIGANWIVGHHNEILRNFMEKVECAIKWHTSHAKDFTVKNKIDERKLKKNLLEMKKIIAIARYAHRRRLIGCVNPKNIWQIFCV